MARVGLFLLLLLFVALAGGAVALLTIEVDPPTRTIERAVPDARIGS